LVPIIVWRKDDALDVMNLGIIIEIVLNLKKDKRNREDVHVSENEERT